MEVVIGVDVRKLAAELESVFAPQIREIVLKIENRVAELNGTATPTAQNLPGKTGNLDIREPTRARDAGVERIVFAIGEEVGVVGSQGKVQVIEAKPEVVQEPRAGGPNPVRGDRIRAYRISVLPVTGRDGVIFSIAKVVADEHHAIEGVLAVEPVVDFAHTVVAGVGVRETAIVRRRIRRGVLDQAACATVWWRRSAAHQFQADGAWRHAARLERIESIHHAVGRIPSQGAGCGYKSPKRVAHKGTQPLIAAEEEQSVFHDRPAHDAAELFQLRRLLRAGRIEVVAGGPGVAAAKRVTRAVIGVGSRPDSDVHNSAGLPAVLGFRIFFEVEFVYGVDGQDRGAIGKRTRHIGDRAVVDEIGIDDAVHHPDGFIGTAVVGALSPWRAPRLDRHARNQIQQILIVASIQRHIVDGCIFEYATKGPARGIHQRDRFADGDGFALLAGLYSHVDSNLRADLDHNVLTVQPLEPRELGADRVCAGNQIGSVILARLIRGQGSREASVLVDYAYRGARYDRAS